MSMRKSRLIVLRGPSGSGKSTVTKRLFDSAKHKVCLIEQDHYRFIFNPPGGGTKPNIDTIHRMIKANVLAALEDGYDVILEGILNVKSYAKVLDDIFDQHSGENYMYYFDISFEETLNRHRTKLNLQEWTENDMKEWYPAAHRSNHQLERIIPQSYSLEKTVETILSESGL
jgi:predicted kinase